MCAKHECGDFFFFLHLYKKDGAEIIFPFFQISKCVKENPFQSKIKTFQKQLVKNSPIYSPSPDFIHWKRPRENIEVFFLFLYIMVFSRKQMYNPFIDSPFGKSLSIDVFVLPVCVFPHTSVWKSPSDVSGVFAEEASQALLCSSTRSGFCPPDDGSVVIVLKLSQDCGSSAVALSCVWTYTCTQIKKHAWEKILF